MCPNPDCDGYLEVTDTDDRQEWCNITYECKDCGKEFIRRTIYQIQSELVESDTLEEIEEEEHKDRKL